jgi:polyhydroxybutyrate depolymerase
MSPRLTSGLPFAPNPRAALCALAFLIAAGCGGAADATDPFVDGAVIPGATTSLTVQVNQATRDYLLHDVQVVGAIKTPLPLVILLHGSDMSAADMHDLTAMDSLADARHFFVAYPQGVGSPTDWNAGTCCGDPQSANTDDIAFIKAVIADVSAKLTVDPKRIYVGGFSDGARMAFRVACQMSDKIAAVAAVSGSLVTQNCAPARLVPIIAFHGNADLSVLYNEPTATPLPRAAPTSAASLTPAVKFWMATASCKNTSSFLFDRTTVRYLGTGCGADVAFYETFGGEHAWPTVGDNYAFSASVLIADFFKVHALP